MDWTFEATDRVSGRRHTIDGGWDYWGPATDPIHEYDGYFAGDDERLYQTRDGDYVLVWRADQLRQYYECKYMPQREARDWFARQGIPWPRRNQITVYEEGTNKACLLDTEAGPSWPGQGYGVGYNNDDYFDWWVQQTLYRRKGWILVDERRHTESDLLSDPTFHWLTDEQAADWLLRNGHPVPDEIAHHAAGRSLDEAEPDPPDYDVERQEKAARLETELGKWFDEATAAPATEPPAGDAGADEPPLASKGTGGLAVETKPKTAAPEAENDGPTPPRSFVLGDKHVELTKHQFRLVDFLWRQDSRLATKRNVSIAVWDDEVAELTRLPSLMSRTNERLSANGVHLTVQPSGDYVRLVIDRP